MPRKASDQVITHRIEMGAWEREHIGKPIAETAQAASLVASGGILLLGGGAALAAYCLYWFWNTVDDIVDAAGSTGNGLWGAIPIVGGMPKPWEYDW